jgi:hypothetical protein
MKTILKKTLIPVLVTALFFGLLLSFPRMAFSQETKDSLTEVSPSLSLSYLCTSNDSVILTARLYFKQDRDIIALQNAVVNFSAANDKDTRELGSAITDSTGNAVLLAGPAGSFPFNADGLVSYTASFSAAGKYLAASESFLAKPAVLKVEFYEEDSVRFVRVTGKKKDSKGADVPITGETVKLYVPSLFRPLPIGEISLDENGTGSVEFPKTLIGDSSGNLVVFGQIEESDLFGNLQGKNTINWGTPKHMIPAERPKRELWTPVAPLWMIITLIIMLAGVWAHYVYAVIQLAKIRRSSKVDVYADKL